MTPCCTIAAIGDIIRHMERDPRKISRITGVVLAGGQSRRFGGNKTLALWRDRPLIEHVVGILAGLFHSCLVVTNTPEAHGFLGLPMAGDISPGRGPLAGIQAALRQIADERACVVAADLPLTSPALLRHLARLSDDDQWDAIVPGLQRGLEPLCAIYRKRTLPVIEEHLRQGKWQVAAVLAGLRVRYVDGAEVLAAGADPASFTNINRPEDLALLTSPQA